MRFDTVWRVAIAVTIVCLQLCTSIPLQLCRSDVADASLKQLLVAIEKVVVGSSTIEASIALWTTDAEPSLIDPASWLNIKFSSPLALFLNGEFTVYYPHYVGKALQKPHHSMPSFTFNDIRIGQRRSWISSILHSRLKNSFFRSLLFGVNEEQDGVSFDDSDYVYQRSPCTDRSVSTGYCSFTVDPFSDVCVFIDANWQDECPATGDEETDGASCTSSEVTVDHFLEYSNAPFTLLDAWDNFAHFRSGSSQPVPLRSKLPKEPRVVIHQRDQREGRTWRLKFINAVRTDLASYAYGTLEAIANISTYVYCLLMGYLIISNSSDLVDNRLMQLFMQILAGVALAIIIICFWLYRVTRKTTDRFVGPLATLAAYPVTIAMVTTAWRYPRLMRIASQALLEFWDTGYPFGIQWIGKAYFLSCIAVTVILCNYMGFFEPDTTSWLALQYAVKGLGLVFLSQSTSNSTASFVLVIVGLFYDNLSYYTWYCWICISGLLKKPTYKYLGKKMTNDEVKVLSAKKTKQALDDLQIYLHNNPSALEVTSDKMREAGRRDEAYLLRRFARGAYPGVPYTMGEDLQAEGNSVSIKRILINVVVTVLGLGVVAFISAAYFRFVSTTDAQ